MLENVGCNPCVGGAGAGPGEGSADGCAGFNVPDAPPPHARQAKATSAGRANANRAIAACGGASFLPCNAVGFVRDSRVWLASVITATVIGYVARKLS
jgi:hypothetical protein